MKRPVLISFLAIVIGLSARAGDFQIKYNHAGLTDVSLDEQGILHFQWHTGRLPFEENGPFPMRQDLSSYDAHASHIWLTKTEVEKLMKWVQDYGILDLPPKFPELKQKTYGSAFQSTLTVALGDKKITSAWSGDSKIPGTLSEGVNALVKLCHQIRLSREGR